MSAIRLELNDARDFTFEEDEHVYRDRDGNAHFSITQMLQKVGIYDYAGIVPSVLENAARRGRNVHRWCAEHDLHGFLDETWMAADEVGYFEAWLKFKRDSKIVIREVERPRLRPIHGFLVGGTPDVIGLIENIPFVVERKACRVKHPGWAIQTAMQEMLITGRPRVGYLARISVQLKPEGTYTTHLYTDPMDGHVALNIVAKFMVEESIRNWMSNAGLKTAA